MDILICTMIGTKKRSILSKFKKCQKKLGLYDKFEIALPEYQTMVNELLYIAQNSPSKQHEGYFDVYWTADRKLIQEMSRYTWAIHIEEIHHQIEKLRKIKLHLYNICCKRPR